MYLPPEIVSIIMFYKDVFETRALYTTKVMAEFKSYFNPEVMESILFLTSTRGVHWDVVADEA